jgi:hypothetical protein
MRRSPAPDLRFHRAEDLHFSFLLLALLFFAVLATGSEEPILLEQAAVACGQQRWVLRHDG